MTFWQTFLGTVLRKYLKWILPVMLLDGCFNRDPYVKVDERFALAAVCGSCPMSLIQRDPQRQERRDEIEKLPQPGKRGHYGFALFVSQLHTAPVFLVMSLV